MLVAKYYKSLQLLREDQARVRSEAAASLDHLQRYQSQMVHEISMKQAETQVYYEKKLTKLTSENRKLNKRLVKYRQASQ